MSTELLFYYLIFAVLGTIIYYLLPKRFRFIVLLVLSMAAVFIYSGLLAFYMIGTALSIYLFGLLISKLQSDFEKKKEGLEKDQKKALKAKYKVKKRWCVFGAIIINLGLLAFLKYANFFAVIFNGIERLFGGVGDIPLRSIVLPLGISYYTLQAISYIVDVYRGVCPADKNILRVGLFVCYFPQLLEGPFSKYNEIAYSLYDGTDFDENNIKKGLARICFGIFKLIMIVPRAGAIADEIFRNYASYNGFMIICGVICFTIQLFCEFSGCIDMAQGVSHMFGVNLAENFNAPFLSQDVGEFWSRWHISLGRWFKDYVFYPISMSPVYQKLNKKNTKFGTFMQVFVPTVLSMSAVWLLTGLWHGASFKYVLYGVYYLVLMFLHMLLEPLFKKLYEKMHVSADSKVLFALRVVKTCILVGIGMLLFRAVTINDAFSMLGRIFSPGKASIANDLVNWQDVVVMCVCLVPVIAVGIMKYLKVDIYEKLFKISIFWGIVLIEVYVFIIIVFGAYGVGYVPPDPIYGAF